ncbi:MAG: hypothetical protein JWN67_3524 [Actinomycetia bacterium]|nr:hypothetical protein [Actinomycetes bacterium]
MLALLTVAVAAAVTVAAMATSAATNSDGEFGDARGLAHLRVTSPAEADAAVASARQRFGTVEVVRHAHAAIPGSVDALDVRTQEPHGTLGRPMLGLRAGRYPSDASEVALTTDATKLLSADIGDRVTLAGARRTVVGRVENPADLHDDFALLAPGDTAPADSLTLLLGSVGRSVDRPSGSTTATAGGDAGTGINFPVQIRGNDKQAAAALVLIATTLTMALVALIAAAGFLVVAQRRQRQLGLLAALGATERHLRLAMLANGVIVGLVAALAGAVVGVVGWLAAAPALEAAIGHRVDRFDLPWRLIVECLALAVVAATAAAWWPARTMARMPVMAALSRRPSSPLPVHRSTALALLLAAGGVAAIAGSRPTGEVRPWMLIGGVIALIAGVVLAAPLAVRALAAPAGWLPFSTRLALRDLVRHQARAAAALAAITLALGISVATGVLAKANEYQSDEGNLSDRQVLVRVGADDTRPDPDLDAAGRAHLDDAAATVGRALGDPERLTIDIPLNPNAPTTNNDTVGVARPLGLHSFRWVTQPYVATPELLAHYGIDPSTIDSTTELLTSRRGVMILLDPTTRDPNGGTPTQRVALSPYADAPNSLVTETAMREHGWIAGRWGWLFETAKPLTDDQRAAARDAAAAAGLRVETRSGQDDLATLRTVSTAIGALLALAIVAMTIGLLRGESAADLRTLTATGAAARTRRALTASTAGALAVLGVVLGAGGAYLALLAAYHADLGRLASPPVTQLLELAIGMPLVASTAGWLLAGREPRTFARQALD